MSPWVRRLRERIASRPAEVILEHHVYVDHDDHGSWASCECGHTFSIRLDPNDATIDANLHLARALSRQAIGHLADELDDRRLLEVLAGAGAGDDELSTVVAICPGQLADEASG